MVTTRPAPTIDIGSVIAESSVIINVINDFIIYDFFIDKITYIMRISYNISVESFFASVECYSSTLFI